MQSNLITFPGVPIPKTTLRDLVARFAAVEAQENPDADVQLSSLRATDQGTIEIPRLGEHVLTDWSKDQLGRAIGISWDRFFAGASPDQRALDLNRRFARARGVVRLRTTMQKEEGSLAAGTIRAVVSTDFASIKDTCITSMLQDALQGTDPDVRVIRYGITGLSTSFVLKLGQAYKIGGPGRVGEVWGGLLVRNSGVGFAKLTVSLHLVRLVCLNGMFAPVPLPSIVRVRHRWLDEGDVREAIQVGLQGIGERLLTGTQVLAQSTHQMVDDIEHEVREVLRGSKLPLRLASGVMSAYRREPHASRFGISQALTLAAQQESPEVRLQLEEAAGRYLAMG